MIVIRLYFQFRQGLHVESPGIARGCLETHTSFLTPDSSGGAMPVAHPAHFTTAPPAVLPGPAVRFPKPPGAAHFEKLDCGRARARANRSSAGPPRHHRCA